MATLVSPFRPSIRWKRLGAMVRCSCCLASAALAFMLTDARAFGAEGDSDAAESAPAQPLDVRIQKLIAQLGDPQYATRERAQSELKRLGTTAFDALYEAQNDEDIEISLRAQYLVRSLTVAWANEDDPIEVKRILRGYGDKKDGQRKTLMDQLAQLPDGLGAEALVRLARFERSPVLSKQAALAVMGLPFSEDPTQRERLAERIDKMMELSKRPSAQWMKMYARTLRDPAGSLEAWRQLVADEQRTLEEFPGKTNRQLVLDLLRWQAEFLMKMDRKTEAEEAMRRVVALAPGAREQIVETVDWLIEHEAWSMVDEITARYAELFQKEPLLTYRLAESMLKRGQKELAEKTAQRAFETQNDNVVERYEWAYWLHQSRGLIAWAEREYRFVIDKEPLVSNSGLKSRQRLAEMLHDERRDGDAGEVYRPVAEAMDSDPNIERGVSQARFDPDGIRSRMHFFLAEAAREKGDTAEQRTQLTRAVEFDPTEADALIAMYQSGADDDAFREKARGLIDSAARSFRELIDQQRRQVEQIGNNEVLRVQGEYYLAQFDNQYAWLVANTFGDYKEALRLSRESLKLRPNTGAFLDTLAHCYYAVGDLENAVKSQRLAVEQDPHSSQIVRKLAFFEKELASSPKKSTP